MIKAVLKNGVVQPLDPFPDNWREGQTLIIEAATDVSETDAPDWVAEVKEAMKHIPPEDHDKLMAAVDEHRREQKEYMRLQAESS